MFFSFKYFVYLLGVLIPKNKKIWTFKGFADKYIDNSKCLFEYVNSNHSAITPIWITANKDTFELVLSTGNRVYLKYSIKGLCYSLIAKVNFYGDYCDIMTNGGSLRVNLWHGIALKKIEFDVNTGPLRSLFNGSLWSRLEYPWLYSKPDYVISSSLFISKNVFSTAFRIPCSRCLNFGYPRNDILFKNKTDLLLNLENTIPNLLYDSISKAEVDQTIYLYLPTWRDSGFNFIEASGIDFEDLNNTMKDLNSIFILKLHPATKIEVDLERFSNIIMLNQNVDLYQLMPFTDVLITDYSSVYFDYLLLNKKIIFFPFDRTEYVKNREFYFDYKDFTPGDIVMTYEELVANMNRDFNSSFKHEIFQKKIWNHIDDQSSYRIVDYFLNYTRTKDDK